MKRIAPVLIPVTMLVFVACNNGRAYSPDTQINVPPATNQPVNAGVTPDTTKNPQQVVNTVPTPTLNQPVVQVANKGPSTKTRSEETATLALQSWPL